MTVKLTLMYVMIYESVIDPNVKTNGVCLIDSHVMTNMYVIDSDVINNVSVIDSNVMTAKLTLM
jgi:hypothetical protein